MKKRAVVYLIALALLVAFTPAASAKEECYPGTIVSHPLYGWTCVNFDYIDCYACEIIVQPS